MTYSVILITAESFSFLVIPLYSSWIISISLCLMALIPGIFYYGFGCFSFFVLFFCLVIQIEIAFLSLPHIFPSTSAWDAVYVVLLFLYLIFCLIFVSKLHSIACELSAAGTLNFF